MTFDNNKKFIFDWNNIFNYSNKLNKFESVIKYFSIDGLFLGYKQVALFKNLPLEHEGIGANKVKLFFNSSSIVVENIKVNNYIIQEKEKNSFGKVSDILKDQYYIYITVEVVNDNYFGNKNLGNVYVGPTATNSSAGKTNIGKPYKIEYLNRIAGSSYGFIGSNSNGINDLSKPGDWSKNSIIQLLVC